MARLGIADPAPERPPFNQRNLGCLVGLSCPEEYHMADNKNPDEKQPGEKPEGKYHYNPGNQAGKTAENVPKEDAKDGEAVHDRS